MTQMVANLGSRQERVVCNIAGTVRSEVLQGREYLVAPIAMMAEGIWEGSDGPIFYSEPDLIEALPSWNNRPLVVYHPQSEGVPSSAADPVVIDKQEVGRVLNAHWKDGKQRSEGWFDVELTKKVDPRVYDALMSNKGMEVSTGLFMKLERAEGTFNSTKYNRKGVSHRPDHLAILPDQIGAFSMKDGGGIFANRKAVGNKMVKNEMSFCDISCDLMEELSSSYGEPGKAWMGWIDEVYDGYVIFYMKGELYMQEYSVDGEEVSLKGKAVQVERKISYVTADGQSVGNSRGITTANERNTNMEKKAKIDKLIANGWSEGERTFLEQLEDKRLDELVANATTPAPEPTPAPTPVVTPTVVNNTTTPAPAVVSPETPEQYLAKMPVALRSVFNQGMAALKQEGERCIAIVLANERNKFTKEQLESMAQSDLSQLQNLAALAAPVANSMEVSSFPFVNFSGAQGAPTPVAPTVNVKPLIMPSLIETKKV
jgi:hypothetical protein